MMLAVQHAVRGLHARRGSGPGGPHPGDAEETAPQGQDCQDCAGPGEEVPEGSKPSFLGRDGGCERLVERVKVRDVVDLCRSANRDVVFQALYHGAVMGGKGPLSGEHVVVY